MGEIIDITKHLNRIRCGYPGLSEKENRDIEEILNSLAQRYIAKLKSGDHSFQFTAVSLEEGAKVQEAINGLRSDLTDIIVELIAELGQSEIRRYIAESRR